MDYEKKYKEALKLARVAAFNGHQSLMEGIFPELAESEDEKTRKEIINYLKKNCRLEWAAWLEKQGETVWGEETDDDAWLNDIISKVESGCTLNSSEIKWLKSIKDKINIHYWTEEEIEPIISDYLRGAEHYGGMIGRLRCLKPKPLEKQRTSYTKSDVDDAYLKGISETKNELEKQGNDNKEYWRGYREGKQEILDKYAELEKQGEQKTAWSEEDDVMIKVFDSIIRYIVEVVDKDVLERFGTNREELFSWLKSIKQRMGG